MSQILCRQEIESERRKARVNEEQSIATNGKMEYSLLPRKNKI